MNLSTTYKLSLDYPLGVTLYSFGHLFEETILCCVKLNLGSKDNHVTVLQYWLLNSLNIFKSEIIIEQAFQLFL